MTLSPSLMSLTLCRTGVEPPVIKRPWIWGSGWPVTRTLPSQRMQRACGPTPQHTCICAIACRSWLKRAKRASLGSSPSFMTSWREKAGQRKQHVVGLPSIGQGRSLASFMILLPGDPNFDVNWASQNKDEETLNRVRLEYNSKGPQEGDCILILCCVIMMFLA